MAYTLLSTGIIPEKGVNYTATTDTSADWSSVANDIYFYDFASDLPYIKMPMELLYRLLKRQLQRLQQQR
jgi:hypothetical protein